jgi:hypothetical protein
MHGPIAQTMVASCCLLLTTLLFYYCGGWLLLTIPTNYFLLLLLYLLLWWLAVAYYSTYLWALAACSHTLWYFQWWIFKLSSLLFWQWWNCLSPYIIWNMSWWSRTCEEHGIITSCPYITFSSLLCYDALMLQDHDQMMPLHYQLWQRPLLLLLLVFFYILLFYRPF